MSDEKNLPSNQDITPASAEAPAKATKKKAAASTKASAPKAAPVPEQVRLMNTMFQVVSIEIRRADGKLVGREIHARSSILWPKLEDYGADVKCKVSRKILKILPV